MQGDKRRKTAEWLFNPSLITVTLYCFTYLDTWYSIILLRKVNLCLDYCSLERSYFFPHCFWNPLNTFACEILSFPHSFIIIFFSISLDLRDHSITYNTTRLPLDPGVDLHWCRLTFVFQLSVIFYENVNQPFKVQTEFLLWSVEHLVKEFFFFFDR